MQHLYTLVLEIRHDIYHRKCHDWCFNFIAPTKQLLTFLQLLVITRASHFTTVVIKYKCNQMLKILNEWFISTSHTTSVTVQGRSKATFCLSVYYILAYQHTCIFVY